MVMSDPIPNLQMNLPRLTTAEFEKISKMIYNHCGIKLETCKKIMLESRLNKRLRALNQISFEQYIDYVMSPEGVEKELMHMIDVVTTNKTDFFREPHHFDFLKNVLLPEFMHAHEQRTFRVWSAACSTGEEPYTLAMVLNEFAKQHSRFSYSILASDISTQVLQKAVNAVYHIDRAGDIPDEYKRHYLLKSKDKENQRIRITADLRNKVQFFRANLTESDYEVEGNLDVIFCRNVLIYFDRQTQYQVISSLLRKLRPGGMLFIGHSESLHFFDLPIKQVRPTVFIKNQ